MFIYFLLLIVFFVVGIIFGYLSCLSVSEICTVRCGLVQWITDRIFIRFHGVSSDNSEKYQHCHCSMLQDKEKHFPRSHHSEHKLYSGLRIVNHRMERQNEECTFLRPSRLTVGASAMHTAICRRAAVCSGPFSWAQGMQALQRKCNHRSPSA